MIFSIPKSTYGYKNLLISTIKNGVLFSIVLSIFMMDISTLKAQEAVSDINVKEREILENSISMRPSVTRQKQEMFKMFFNTLNPSLDYTKLINAENLSQTDAEKAEFLILEADKAYENNQISEENRYAFYRNIIDLYSDYRQWPVELKSIVLIKLVEFDTKSKVPAYKQLELREVRLSALVNDFISDEFSHIAQRQYEALEHAKAQGYDVEEVELSDEEREKAISDVYQKLVNESNRNYLFKK